ncbi:hypothetical protein [uncultured Methylobacterium sp.]|uniref:hypothetical protein n=1 Tax=uncultured Methylobacterium sp. TaxID=157278 RepID=UPI002592D45C|nr:hypothetical protein [uncultured Methylobacterium sp.]
MAAFDIGNNIDLDRWISWPKNSFQKILLEAIDAAKQEEGNNSIDQSSKIEDIANDQNMGDLFRQISLDIAQQMVKKLPFDRLSYLIEYRQTLSNQNILINSI